MKQTLRSAWRSALLVLPACLIFTGCGSSSSAPAVGKLAAVTGKVTLKGQPLIQGSVMFTPITGTPGTGAYGVTSATGEYKLLHRSQEVGIEPGKYRVTITRMAQKDGSPIPEGKTAADVEAVQVVPWPYSDPASEDSATIVMVPDSGGSFNFEIPG